MDRAFQQTSTSLTRMVVVGNNTATTLLCAKSVGMSAQKPGETISLPSNRKTFAKLLAV
jgi:hypothetical protein